jgi:hypothetical protein
LGVPGYSWVSSVADRLLADFNEDRAQQRLTVANLPGQSSAMVRATFRHPPDPAHRRLYSTGRIFTGKDREPERMRGMTWDVT